MLKYLLFAFLVTLVFSSTLVSDSERTCPVPSLAEEAELINAGVTIAINENFFNKLLTDLLPNILRLIGDEFISTKIYEINLDMITIFISKPQLLINEIYYDPKLTKADLYSNNNSLGLHIIDSRLNLTLNYDVFTDPPIIDDIGNATFGYDDLNLDVILGMSTSKEDPEKFAIEVSESLITINPKSVKVDLTNENDFNKLVISVVNAVLPPVANLVGTAVSEYLQNGLDLVTDFLKWPMTIQGIDIDLSFKELPAVSDDKYITISSIGEVSPAGTDLPFVNSAMLPKWLPDGKDFQVFISDYTILSGLTTVAQLNLVKLSITEKDTKVMKTSYLSSFFPELVKVYGKNKPCRLDIEIAADPLPQLSISPKGIDSSTFLNMKLSVDPGDGYQEAFSFKVDSKIVAILDIDKDLTIKMKINDLKVRVTEIISSNIDDVSIKKVNNVMSLLLNLIKTLVNTLLSNGIDLSIFLRNLPLALKDIMISPRTGYYLIMANPYFEENSVEKFFDYLTSDDGLLKYEHLYSPSLILPSA